MTRYALYDPTLDDSPVLGYFDTDQDDYELPGGDQLFPLTDDQWNSRLTGTWSIRGNQFLPATPPVIPPPPAPTLEEQADEELATRLGTGIAITSASAPGLNGTYALDQISTGQIFQIGLFANQLHMFPDGTQTFQYPDQTGVPHVFTVGQFVAFFLLVASIDFNITKQAQLMKGGQLPAWPTQTGQI